MHSENKTNNQKLVFCIIPALNEAGTIKKVIQEVSIYVDGIIVVDDGSKDDTSKIAGENGAYVLTHSINRGQGAALETGNRFALEKGAGIIVHFDADGQFSAREIPDLIEPIRKGEADMVFGSRFMSKKSNMPFSKRFIIMPIARAVNLILFGAKLSDPQSGFRAFSRETAGKIKIEQDDMAHCSEIIGKSFSLDLRIKEVPITVIFNDYGSGFKRGFKVIKDHLLAKFID